MFCAVKKVIIDIPSDSNIEKESACNARKALRIIETPAGQKENIHSRDCMTLKPIEHGTKRKRMNDASVQTLYPKPCLTAEDLTSEAASLEYYRLLAERTEQALNESMEENLQLKDQIAVLQDENNTCKELLKESNSLVEVLKEMLNEDEEEEGDENAAEEATMLKS